MWFPRLDAEWREDWLARFSSAAYVERDSVLAAVGLAADAASDTSPPTGELSPRGMPSAASDLELAMRLSLGMSDDAPGPASPSTLPELPRAETGGSEGTSSPLAAGRSASASAGRSASGVSTGSRISMRFELPAMGRVCSADSGAMEMPSSDDAALVEELREAMADTPAAGDVALQDARIDLCVHPEYDHIPRGFSAPNDDSASAAPNNWCAADHALYIGIADGMSVARV